MCSNVNIATAEVVSGNGRKMELKHSRRDLLQRHAGKGMEKDFVTKILGARVCRC